MPAQEHTRAADNNKTVVPLPHTAPATRPGHSAFVPVLLGTLALIGWLGWQTSLLLSDREALHTAHAGQHQTVENAAKLRGSLDGLAADTQRLAEAGNGSAAALVAELKKRGITINPQAGAAAPK